MVDWYMCKPLHNSFQGGEVRGVRGMDRDVWILFLFLCGICKVTSEGGRAGWRRWVGEDGERKGIVQR